MRHQLAKLASAGSNPVTRSMHVATARPREADSESVASPTVVRRPSAQARTPVNGSNHREWHRCDNRIVTILRHGPEPFPPCLVDADIVSDGTIHFAGVM